MAPKLSDYLSEDEVIAVKGSLSRPISGLAIDSRRVVPGNVFFALPGLRTDGAHYVDEAISRGAVAIVAESMPRTVPSKVTYIHAANPRALVATVAQRFNKSPDRDLNVVGITGTNGKTTVAHLVRHFLGGETPVGLLGTISYDLGARTVPSFKTTPEAIDTYGMLAQMRDAGCREAVMEVSSHGIDQQRINGLRFGAAVYTNLTRDHLDYHSSMEEYFEVKSRLFTGEQGPRPVVAVINLDDPYSSQLLARLDRNQAHVTYGENTEAKVRAEDVVFGFKETSFRLIWPQGEMTVSSPLIGRFNLSNVLAAVATAYGMGRDPAAFVGRLDSFAGVPGRMERVEEGQPFNVLVDYAHTDDALRNAVAMLRPVTPGRLLVVFGCGGNRDRAKRAMMVRAVQEQADFVFATADNPRREELSQIFHDMEEGVTDPSKITWIEDRRRAISLALDMAKPGDSLLIAGKGHEPYQEFADTVVPFDDRLVARELIAIKRIAAS
ncbi:UDP-N-acetylmuramoyl-L-alanyl-D-glutamate--2,6-diaminopimelate ligase [Synoicihabitans lomoniglobus]|uniref:UDP-N-acetylmuramoyl-L-alanyl-D-glutamate--2,6-diaminopimelate ligase n=1 Tax=Synoicihabitans lomoniglobus TaxID=2909285 RepID=A0AAF0I6K9_9BACT|nr:UDP-N-acetylmuramoyl-L-alanyl-D-glutamate--2,6-diaminopimelate ligase [Opitutaceae bacterium LMO-M01]WED66151.1 UDP-N-acetylmuramoyl-L-alanyl-D-glutamate--2,6-diaminopimelate ligase [Opitutaceae bacterium LMO-M01]